MAKAIIVGGGIGGLAAAVALTRHGWDVEVLERATMIAEVGAGLSLWSNALRALDALGLGDQVRERAVEQDSAGIRDSKGHWISRADTEAIRTRFGSPIMMHRADLLDILRAALPEAALRTGISVTAAHPDGTVTHSAGTDEGDLIVGADGLRSVVRRAVVGDITPRYRGYTAWRVIITPTEPLADLGETWGRGERFGYVPLSDGRVYCFATANLPADTPGDGLAELRRRFGTWHAPHPRPPGRRRRIRRPQARPLRPPRPQNLCRPPHRPPRRRRPRHDPQPRPRRLPSPRRRRNPRPSSHRRPHPHPLRHPPPPPNPNARNPLPPPRRLSPTLRTPTGRPPKHRPPPPPHLRPSQFPCPSTGLDLLTAELLSLPNEVAFYVLRVGNGEPPEALLHIDVVLG